MSAINLSEVLKLPIQERIRIVEAIWDSVAEHPEQVELLPWQAEELDRRVATYQANPSEAFPGRRSTAVFSMAREAPDRFLPPLCLIRNSSDHANEISPSRDSLLL